MDAARLSLTAQQMLINGGIKPFVLRTEYPTALWQWRQYGTWLETYTPTHIPRCKNQPYPEQLRSGAYSHVYI